MILWGLKDDNIIKTNSLTELAWSNFYDHLYIPSGDGNYLRGRHHFVRPKESIKAFSAGIWFNTKFIDTSYSVLLAERDYAVSDPDTSQWEFYLDTDGVLRLKIYNGITTLVQDYETSLSYNDGLTHHALATWQGGTTITNGTFGTDTGWDKGTGWTIGAGTASSDGSQSTDSLLTTLSNIDVRGGDIVRVEYTVSGYSAGNLTPAIVNTPSGVADFEFRGTSVSSNGSKSTDIYIDGPLNLDYHLAFIADLNFVGSIDDVSSPDIVEIYVDGSATTPTQNSHTDQQNIASTTNTKFPPLTIGMLIEDNARTFEGLLRAPFYSRRWTDATLAAKLGQDRGADAIPYLSPVAWMRPWSENL